MQHTKRKGKERERERERERTYIRFQTGEAELMRIVEEEATASRAKRSCRLFFFNASI